MAESQFPVSSTPVDGVEWQSVRNEFASAATVAVDQSHILSANSKWGDYLDCYWRHFHPLFPILHYTSTLTNPPPPALAVLMIIIGAQFSTLPASKNHSMGMYDSYVKLFSTVSLLMFKARMDFGLTSGFSKCQSPRALAFRTCRRYSCSKLFIGIGHGKLGSKIFPCLLNFGLCTPA